jgi:DNA-damage-inducible protein D
MMACESAGVNSDQHFRNTAKAIASGNGALVQRGDYYLSRYACYLIAMNGDTSKPEIGLAQTYFAIQTRRQEIEDKLTDEEKRLQLRERVKHANKHLNSAAKQAGVQRFGLFHDAGYKGLYSMGKTAIKIRKGISPNDELLDCAGRTELAANEFRITQTEERLRLNKLRGETTAMNTHYAVGMEVRNSIKRIGGTMPEDLPAEPNIKKLAHRNKNKKTTQVKKLP